MQPAAGAPDAVRALSTPSVDTQKSREPVAVKAVVDCGVAPAWNDAGAVGVDATPAVVKL